MKVGFPLTNDTELAHDFAHSKFIGIIDLQTGSKKVVPVGCDLLSEKEIFETLVKSSLNEVISPFYTFMSLRIFKENNITTYKAKGKSMDDNIHLYKLGKMKPFDIYESLLTGPCAKDCLSCSPEEDCEP
jgi:predicted Fe-Mo cluster-binding NifX family protein